MKLVTIVGARPQFIKAAAVSRVLRERHTEILVHTGQHYDPDMSDIFFEEMHIPRPDYNLGAGSGSHARQTAAMLTRIEEVLEKEKPAALLCYGDTNSTLAGALAASKLCIPVIHVEAGLRSFDMRMPEEQNRALTDRLSSLLFCPTDTAVENLRKEGIIRGVYQVGDVMCDAVRYYAQLIDAHERAYYFSRARKLFPAPDPEGWYLATIHRAENTQNAETIRRILDAFEELDLPVIFPVHPRTRCLVESVYAERGYRNIVFLHPVGYLDMLFYLKYAKKAITDSGGLQKEAYLLHTPCITVRGSTEWTETLTGAHNLLCRPEKEELLEKVLHTAPDPAAYRNHYGDGRAAEKISELIEKEELH